MSIMSPKTCKGYTFASFRRFKNQPRDKDGITNSDNIKIFTGSEGLSIPVETPSFPTV